MGTNAWSRRTGSIGCGWDRQVVDGDHLQFVRVVDDPDARAANQPFQVTISMPPERRRPGHGSVSGHDLVGSRLYCSDIPSI